MESPGCRSGSLKFCTIGLAVVVTDAGPWGDKDGNEDDRDRPHDLRLMIYILHYPHTKEYTIIPVA